MRKIFAWILGIALTVFLFTWTGFFFSGLKTVSPTSDDDISKHPSPPPRVIQSGPYGTNVSTTSVRGECRYHIRTSQLYFTGSRILVFENALWKKLVARSLRLTVYQGDEKQIALSKDKAALTPGINPIRLKNPTILYPEDLGNIRTIEIDTKSGRIHIIDADNQPIIWQLDCQTQSKPTP